MLPEHSRSGMAHHSFDLFPAIPLIAMHRTLGAGGLFRAEMAPIQAQAHVAGQFLTFPAQVATVLIAAVDAQHGGDGAPLAGKSPLGQFGGSDGREDRGIIRMHLHKLGRVGKKGFEGGQGLGLIRHGTASDAEIARQLSRTRTAVKSRRQQPGISLRNHTGDPKLPGPLAWEPDPRACCMKSFA